jgi:hypothetical protein
MRTIIIFLISVAPCLAFDPVTHVWIAQQVLDDVSADGRVSILGDEYPVPARSVEALRAHAAHYRMGAVGPDAVPDVLTGQATAHAGAGGGWKSDDWLRHVQRAAEGESTQALAFALGCWTHAASDIFAHTYVNRYAGRQWSLRDRETTADTRHVVLERFIGRHTPRAAPWDAVALPAGFVARALVLDERADAQYARVPSAQVPRAMGALERAVRALSKRLGSQVLAAWHANILQAIEAYVRANTDVVRNLMRPSHADPSAPLKDWAKRWGPVLVGVPPDSRLKALAGRAIGAVKPALGGLARRVANRLKQTADAGGEPDDVSRVHRAAAELAGMLGDRWHDSPTMQHVALLRSANTEDALTRIFTEGSGRLPIHRDIVQRVRADMGVPPGGTMTPDSFAPAHDAIVLSKLALLDAAQLNALATKHGAGAPFDSGRLCLLDRAVHSLDASAQWRQPGFTLWSKARPLFCKLFRSPDDCAR